MSSLVKRDLSSVWHPFTQVGLADPPIPVVAAEGACLVLEDGTKLIDGISSWWCNTHGHCNRHLMQAAAEQMQRLDHVIFAGFTHEPAVSLAEELLAALNRRFDRVFFTDNGSTAVEAAIKMAIQFWANQGQRRTRIIALEDSYHGDTFGAMAAGARGLFVAPFEEMLFEVLRISTRGSVEDLKALNEYCARGDVAAFIFEPRVQGAGGMKVYDLEILEQYLSICRDHGVLCIADEVMTGFGRTGPLFVSQRLCVPPDLLCLSKGLTGGTLPLAVTLCRNELFEAFRSNDHSRTFFHGHTYTANPIACAVARASLRLTESAECVAQRKLIELRHTECAAELSRIPGVVDPRIAGTILAFNVATRGGCGYTSSISVQALRFFRERGILIRPLGEVVYCMPPYCITESELKKVHAALVEFAGSVCQEITNGITITSAPATVA